MTVAAYAGSVLLAVIHTILIRTGGQRGNKLVFNANKAFAAAVMFLAAGIASFSFHVPTLLYGLAYGVFFALSMWTGLRALTSGPLALTNMIISFSLIVPCLYGVLFLGESLSFFGILGLAMLAGSFILLGLRKNERPADGKWLAYTVITLFSDGCCTVIKKSHQTAFPGMYRMEFMFWSLVLVFAVFVVILVFGQRPEKGTPLIDVRGMVCGLLNGGSSFLGLYLMATENVSVQAPVVAGLTAAASLAAGRVVFGEKLTPMQRLGFVMGVGSVVLLKL